MAFGVARRLSLAILLFVLLSGYSLTGIAQQQYELNDGWQCRRASAVSKGGEELSRPGPVLAGWPPFADWLPAVVPGTVLTSLLANNLIPDPFYGMNNKQIPDIYTTGRDYYTYWFVKDFTEKRPGRGGNIWLQMRGVNNSCDIYLNGRRLAQQEKSMLLRHEYNITALVAKDGRNRLAIIVYPPGPPGNPNGGQGGDGMIAHSLTNQYTAGWDWIQPVHDRNTGIWDKVILKKTGPVTIANTHIITIVPGKRLPGGGQQPAIIKVTADASNTDAAKPADGLLEYELQGKKITVKARLEPGATVTIAFPDLNLPEPALWWPNGAGPQNLYQLHVRWRSANSAISDEENVQFGIRQIDAVWDTTTHSRQLCVNGQPIFIKGGNRILTDEMLRATPERYDAEVRYHRDMNLNLIRVWGGGITERPEFYDACDKYGLLVMQDFWVSGDCNGRWDDPLKLEDTTARRNYPDDHRLFAATLRDQVLLLRNHPSLAIWCGGNEIRPPADVLAALKDTLLPQLDGTRILFDYSNDDSMSYHSGDGPYTLQPDRYFWEHRSFPFNSEVGSVGIGDYESLQRFLPPADMVAPWYDKAAGKWVIDSVWQYHKYISYDSAIEVYGHPKDVQDFALKAQLVNYNQYRALIEGATAHMWDWYTGIIIWKTQNPWTAMVGQMYDVYLDPNACLYGLAEGAKPIHIMYDPVNKSVRIANNTFVPQNKLRMVVKVYRMDGYAGDIAGEYVQAPAQSAAEYYHFKSSFRLLSKDEGVFLNLSLTDSLDNVLDDNLYWLPDAQGNYSGLATLPQAAVTVTARQLEQGAVQVVIANPGGGPVAFFNRISVVDAVTKKRVLPAFCNNNYISVVPGQQNALTLQYTPQPGASYMVCIEGWNVDKRFIKIN